MAGNASVEDVRRMSMDELCEILDRENVDYSELEDIEEIRDLVLQFIAQRESPNDERDSQKEATIDVMGRILERDAEMRKVISEIYGSVLAMLTMKNFEKNLGSEMTKEYNGYIGTVERYRKQLERTHCPIVVAGETGAGKSSLLNLIMGEHVLPRQVLSSTSTICQIFNSEQKRAVVTDENGTKFPLDDVTEETLSKYVCVDRSGENKQRYKTVDIYWPVPMLKEHATIVDTPGVGESDEMTTKLLDYLSEAVAFIYVINTTNAGGVQDDRLVKIFKKQLELEQKGLLQQFDPECAIFVCNKWDQVPDREDEMVWRDIAKKLQANWPTRRHIDITGQMFKMSVTKDLQRSKAGLGYSDKFKSLISGIDRLVSASLERRVKKHIEAFQHNNIVRCLGVSIERIGSQKEYLNIFMEVCECSLADIIICDQHMTEMCQCNSYRRKTCHMFKEKDRNVPEFVEAWELFTKMLEGILNGLVYLHDLGFVHRDLKLTNILIKDKTAKIADVGMSKPKNHLQGTITGTPVFMAPEVLEGRMYGLSADIFSLAIMMWEMWYGRRVFSESIYSDVMTTYSSIKEHVLSGQRPRFTEKTAPPEEIRTMMKECWEIAADKRPGARKLTTRLKEIVAYLTLSTPC